MCKSFTSANYSTNHVVYAASMTEFTVHPEENFKTCNKSYYYESRVIDTYIEWRNGGTIVYYLQIFFSYRTPRISQIWQNDKLATRVNFSTIYYYSEIQVEMNI